MFLFPNIFLPTNTETPPTLYDLMDSIVNFDREEKIKIKDLASYAREKIFDFNYPLSEYVDKEDFEVLILNKFIMRRIAYETFTAWQIALNVKLNEIMPNYNKLFDMLGEWDIFEEKEVETRSVHDARITTNTGNDSSSVANTVSGTNTSDRRSSNTPQNELSDVRDGKYVDLYNYDTDTSSVTNNTSSIGTSSNTMNDSSNLSESIERDRTDRIKIYTEFLDKRQSIYTLIFNELDSLFYALRS